jgi:multidrug resistance protein
MERGSLRLEPLKLAKTRSISPSKSSQKDDGLERKVSSYSAQHFDDHAVYSPPGVAEGSAETAVANSHHKDARRQEEDYEKSPIQDLSRDGKKIESESAPTSPTDPQRKEDLKDIEKDAEKTSISRKAPTAPGGGEGRDPFLVSWAGPDDSENPKNWKFGRKWAATAIVSAFTFMSPVSSSMVAPAVSTLAKDLGIKTELESGMALSIFVLAYAIGPLFLAPLSEVYGRVIVIQLSNIFFLVWNLACGFAYNVPEIMVFRFLAGLGGSAPLAVGGGVLGDLWRPEERGKAIALYTLGPLLGPAVGPIAGGFIAQNSTWRWVFWSTTIATTLVQVLGFFYLQETFAPLLLQRRAAKLRKETGNDAYYTTFDTPDRTLRQILFKALTRPFRLLFTQPIIMAIASRQSLWKV